MWVPSAWWREWWGTGRILPRGTHVPVRLTFSRGMHVFVIYDEIYYSFIGGLVWPAILWAGGDNICQLLCSRRSGVLWWHVIHQTKRPLYSVHYFSPLLLYYNFMPFSSCTQVRWSLFPYDSALLCVSWISWCWQVLSWLHVSWYSQASHTRWSGGLVDCRCISTTHWPCSAQQWFQLGTILLTLFFVYNLHYLEYVRVFSDVYQYAISAIFNNHH